MRDVYNLYYKNQRINKLPLTEEEIKKIYEKNNVYKMNGNKKEKIELNDIFIRKCIII